MRERGKEDLDGGMMVMDLSLFVASFFFLYSLGREAILAGFFLVRASLDSRCVVCIARLERVHGLSSDVLMKCTTGLFSLTMLAFPDTSSSSSSSTRQHHVYPLQVKPF